MNDRDSNPGKSMGAKYRVADKRDEDGYGAVGLHTSLFVPSSCLQHIFTFAIYVSKNENY
jgi:hypothetical protein